MNEDSKEHLQRELSALITTAESLTVLYMGSELRGDDQIGIYIGEQLQTLQYKNKIHPLIVFTVPTNFLSKIVASDPDHILVVDAVKISEEGGTVAFFQQDAVLNTKSTSTHYQEFNDILLFLQQELDHPVTLSVLGIQVESTEFNTELTVEVKKTADQIVAILHKIFS